MANAAGAALAEDVLLAAAAVAAALAHALADGETLEIVGSIVLS